LTGIDIARTNLDGLNSTINRSKERVYDDEIPRGKVNMYKFLEYNRPSATPSFSFRMRDNYKTNPVESPMSRNSGTIDMMNNQSTYSMEGSPIGEHAHIVYDSLPPKSPTPELSHMGMPQINNCK
jgi:hypothetical protein